MDKGHFWVAVESLHASSQPTLLFPQNFMLSNWLYNNSICLLVYHSTWCTRLQWFVCKNVKWAIEKKHFYVLRHDIFQHKLHIFETSRKLFSPTNFIFLQCQRQKQQSPQKFWENSFLIWLGKKLKNLLGGKRKNDCYKCKALRVILLPLKQKLNINQWHIHCNDAKGQHFSLQANGFFPESKKFILMLRFHVVPSCCTTAVEMEMYVCVCSELQLGKEKTGKQRPPQKPLCLCQICRVCDASMHCEQFKFKYFVSHPPETTKLNLCNWIERIFNLFMCQCEFVQFYTNFLAALFWHRFSVSLLLFVRFE